MPSKGTGDPWLKGPDWEAIKAHWRRKRLPCSVCGEPIDYRVGARGPRTLDVGHWPVSRAQARARGWTRQQCNTISNTRPECRTCSRSNGASMGNAMRRDREPAEPDLIDDDW